jgi:hypothetical protein
LQLRTHPKDLVIFKYQRRIVYQAGILLRSTGRAGGELANIAQNSHVICYTTLAEWTQLVFYGLQ